MAGAETRSERLTKGCTGRGLRSASELVSPQRQKQGYITIMKKTKWLRDILLIPLVVGLLITLVALLLPRLFIPKSELSYTVDPAFKYLAEKETGKMLVEISGVPVEEFVGHKVRLWNSGQKPIKELPVLFVFSTVVPDFKILGVEHNTNPPYEFGAIQTLEKQPNLRRFKYDLLNPQDADVITLWTNRSGNLKVFAKSEGLVVQDVPFTPGKSPAWKRLLPITAGLVGLFSSFITIFGAWFLRRYEPPNPAEIKLRKAKELRDFGRVDEAIKLESEALVHLKDEASAKEMSLIYTNKAIAVVESIVADSNSKKQDYQRHPADAKSRRG